jgi:hypothetical protein
MSFPRVSVAMPFTQGDTAPTDFIPVFHDWIRRGAVEGLLIDVANYSHVHNGPGVMLIGHEGDYSVDMVDGRPMLRYMLKRDHAGETKDLVARSLRRLQGAAKESASLPGGGVGEGEITVRIYDRLREADAHRPAVESGLREVLGPDAQLDITSAVDDPRAPVTLVARVAR